jgi:hypothetical protein
MKALGNHTSVPTPFQDPQHQEFRRWITVGNRRKRIIASLTVELSNSYIISNDTINIIYNTKPTRHLFICNRYIQAFTNSLHQLNTAIEPRDSCLPLSPIHKPPSILPSMMKSNQSAPLDNAGYQYHSAIGGRLQAGTHPHPHPRLHLASYIDSTNVVNGVYFLHIIPAVMKDQAWSIEVFTCPLAKQ